MKTPHDCQKFHARRKYNMASEKGEAAPQLPACVPRPIDKARRRCSIRHPERNRQGIHLADTIMDNVDGTLRTAIEQAADGIMLTDLSGVIQYVNAAFEGMSGYARGDVIGRHVRLLKSGQHEAAFYR